MRNPHSPSGLVLLREEWNRIDDLAESVADGLGMISAYHSSKEAIPREILEPLRQSLLRLARLLTPPPPPPSAPPLRPRPLN